MNSSAMIDAGDSISTIRQLKRQPAVAARNVEQLRARLTIQVLNQEVSFCRCLFRRNRPAPKVERDAVEKGFEPIGWDGHFGVRRLVAAF